MTRRAVCLYGVPHSLYTGKTRAYLRKQGIDYVERLPTDPVFRERVLPQLGRSIIPVVTLPDGRLIQDSVEILDHFETLGVRVSARPPGARQRVVAHLLELYAVVGLTRHAMHYRWSYLGEQQHFLRQQFALGAGEEAADKLMQRMHSYLPMLGVTAATIPVIEASFEQLLDTLEAHFAAHPYLLGGRPSIGDYGMLGPLYAHLGRDPVPAGILCRRAPRVLRWLERMNAPDPDMPEFPDRPAEYLPDDRIPGTIKALLRQAAAELMPELLDKLAALSAHVDRTNPADGSPVVPKPHQRSIGSVLTHFRGVAHESGVQPYMLYLWQRVGDAYEALSGRDRQSVRALLSECGLLPVLEAPRPFRVERSRHREVWRRVRTSPDPRRNSKP